MKFFEHSTFIPIFAQHHYLKKYNQTAFIETLRHIFEIKFKGMDSDEILYQLLNQTDAVMTSRYLENHTSRLIFTFNRLTSLGYLLRSPILKGLGYHPLINTEVPTKLKQNFEIFIQMIRNESYGRQIEIIDYIKLKNPSNMNELKSDHSRRLN